MAKHTTYSQARANFASYCNMVADDREIVLINRRNKEDVALIAASELSSLLETAHLLRSPKNAQRLFTALQRALSRSELPQSIAEFKRDTGIDEKKAK